MIRHAKIENFRCFPSLELSDLKRINVIVGANASGKTAFLESLFLASSCMAPASAVILRTFRHIGPPLLQVPQSTSAAQEVWSDLFYWYRDDKGIFFEFVGDEGDTRSLTIEYGDAGGPILPFEKQPVSATFLPQITFTWRRGTEPPVPVKPKFTPTGLVFEGADSTAHFPIILFTSNAPDPPDELAKRFSALNKTGQSSEIVNALRAEFPFVHSLSVEFNAGTWTIFASLKTAPKHEEHKLPVGLLSAGVNKLLSILLGIASFKKGIVLIDQIEDGFYYERMPSIWKTIYKAAKAANSQLFVTTHSMECLRAMLPAMKGHEDDFKLLRAERTNDHSAMTEVKGRFLGSALEQGFEVR